MLSNKFRYCAVFREGLQEERKGPIQIKSAQEVKPIVYGSFNGKVSLNGDSPAQMNQGQINNWAGALGNILNGSKLFSSLAKDPKESDYIVEMNLLETSNYNKGLALLTGLTLYLFPSSGNTHFVLKTTFKNKKGDVLGEVEKQEKFTLWQQVLLIFVMPFKYPTSVIKDIQSDLIHYSIQEGEDKGYFSSTKGTPAKKGK